VAQLNQANNFAVKGFLVVACKMENCTEHMQIHKHIIIIIIIIINEELETGQRPLVPSEVNSFNTNIDKKTKLILFYTDFQY